MPPAESPGAISVDSGYTPGATGLEGVRKPHQRGRLAFRKKQPRPCEPPARTLVDTLGLCEGLLVSLAGADLRVGQRAARSLPERRPAKFRRAAIFGPRSPARAKGQRRRASSRSSTRISKATILKR